jgi:hypothetical protein
MYLESCTTQEIMRMQKKTDITLATLRLAELVAPNDVALWGAVVQRDRALIAALAGEDPVLMHKLSGLHQSMWQTIQGLRR